MFEDQKVELLPERTTMYNLGHGRLGALNALHALNALGSGSVVSQNGNIAIAIAINVGNVNIGGTQINTAVATAVAGSNVAAVGG